MLLPAIKELTFKLLTSACSFEVDCCRMSLAGASSLSLMHFALALPSMSTTVSRAASRSSTYLEHSKISCHQREMGNLVCADLNVLQCVNWVWCKTALLWLLLEDIGDHLRH